MHDDRVICIAINAFADIDRVTGSDDFGYSVAWIDLDDNLEPDGLDNYELYPTAESVSEYVKTWRDVAGCRWALAYWDANGNRSAVGYEGRADMMAAYRAIESEYLAWAESE